MSTPEGKVKAKVSKILGDSTSTYYHMPVPGGFGGTTLDYIGSNLGRFFAIETKAPGKRPTARQLTIINQIRASGGRVFVIDGTKETDTYEELQEWLWTDASA